VADITASLSLLGTHDIQNITIACASSLNLSVDYLDGSRARGVLCLALRLTPEQTVDFTKSVSVVIKRDILETLNFHIPNGGYIFLGYDVESDGLVLRDETLYPAYREDLIVTESEIGEAHSPQSIQSAVPQTRFPYMIQPPLGVLEYNYILASL
jgi:hypothetical protein